jgi:hypothetical protein
VSHGAKLMVLAFIVTVTVAAPVMAGLGATVGYSNSWAK